MQKYIDIFRIKLGADEPAKVDPYRLSLKENYQPFRCTQRRYAPAQKVFIESTIRSLERIGAIKYNPTAKWASPALAVPKPGTKSFRFTVDLRGVNKQTVPVASAMPDLESMIRSIGDSKIFAKMDMVHAYWQIPLHPDSQEAMSIQTPIGVYTPQRILQGSTDAGNHFQSTTSQIFTALHDWLLQWVDDFLMHSRFDPRNLKALQDMQYPTTGGELQQFMCATNWMRMGIPEYAVTVAPLHSLLEECYNAVGKRTKKAVAKLKIGENWRPEHAQAFEAIRNHLQEAVTLAFPKPQFTRCLFTDASDGYWAAVLTHMTGGGTVHIWTDHANLTYIFDPFGRNPGINRQVANKLLRWALKLCGHRYVIEFLSGSRNVWADLLTRWAAPYTERQAKLAVLYAPINPSGNSDYDWPNRNDIIKSQQKSKSERPKHHSLAKGIVLDGKNRTWIPEDDAQLKLRILIAAHCGIAGHRAKTTTALSISISVILARAATVRRTC